MPSWPDGESGDSYSWLDNVSEAASPPRPIPYTDHPDWCGADPESKELCECGGDIHRWIAADGEDLGRRFLGCQKQDDTRCTMTIWRDPEWSPYLKGELQRLYWRLEDRGEAKHLEMLNAIADAQRAMDAEKEQLVQQHVGEKIKLVEELELAKKTFEDHLLEKLRTSECKHAEEQDEIKNLKIWVMVSGAVAVSMFAVVMAFVFERKP